MPSPPTTGWPPCYWLATLPETTSLPELVRLGKIRWRIAHDYCELKTGLGLDNFEGRTWPGWHRHVTLVAAAQLFLTCSGPAQSSYAGLSLYQVLHELPALLATWTGTCTVCGTHLDTQPAGPT